VEITLKIYRLLKQGLIIVSEVRTGVGTSHQFAYFTTQDYIDGMISSYLFIIVQLRPQGEALRATGLLFQKGAFGNVVNETAARCSRFGIIIPRFALPLRNFHWPGAGYHCVHFHRRLQKTG